MAVDRLLHSHAAQPQRLLDLFLAGDFSSEMLTDRRARLEATVDPLQKERAKTAASLDADRLTDDQTRSIQEFAGQVRSGLECADEDFSTQRKIAELLDAEATLAVENGQRVIHASCRLDREVLSLARTSRWGNSTDRHQRSTGRTAQDGY